MPDVLVVYLYLAVANTDLGVEKYPIYATNDTTAWIQANHYYNTDRRITDRSNRRLKRMWLPYVKAGLILKAKTEIYATDFAAILKECE